MTDKVQDSEIGIVLPQDIKDRLNLDSVVSKVLITPYVPNLESTIQIGDNESWFVIHFEDGSNLIWVRNDYEDPSVSYDILIIKYKNHPNTEIRQLTKIVKKGNEYIRNGCGYFLINFENNTIQFSDQNPNVEQL